MLEKNTWKHLTGLFKNVSAKWIYKSYIFDIYAKTGFGIT